MRRLARIFILFILLGVFPLTLPVQYVGLITRILILTVFAMSLDILMGYTGLTSLGHSAFFGVSGYTVALVNLSFFHGSNHFIIEFSLAILIAAFTAAFFGLIAVRTKGVYFMMVTLALGEMMSGLALKWQSLTGGVDGLPGISRPKLISALPWNLPEELKFFYFVFPLFSFSCIMMYLIVSSPFGKALAGIRENETKMEILGFNIWLHKYIAFVIAGTFAGLAGILDVYYYKFVSPDILGTANSVTPLMALILGGTRTSLGPVIGCAIYVCFEHIISGYTQRWLMAIGLLFILIIIFTPRGLSPAMGRLWSLVKNRLGS